MDKIQIKDESGDKKYFTIIPNYIFNHSTLWDREVYCQMKRIAGENGTCWTSRKTLAKQCGISIERLKKSIKYLIENKWIESVGKRKVITRGGEQEVNEYKISDLWNVNNIFYQEKLKGGSPESTPLNKGGSPKKQRGVAETAKGGSPGSSKEEPCIKEEPLNNILSAEADLETSEKSSDVSGINLLIEKFKPINPSYERLFANITQRKALERLTKKYTPEKVGAMIDALPGIVSQKYAPQISTPAQLENKLGQLLIFIKQNKQQKGEIIL